MPADALKWKYTPLVGAAIVIPLFVVIVVVIRCLYTRKRIHQTGQMERSIEIMQEKEQGQDRGMTIDTKADYV